MPDGHPTIRAAFEGLSPDEVQTILSGTSTARISAGEALFLQGDPADRFFLLKEGWLKVTQVTTDGQKLIVRIVHPGEFFGFAPALQRDAYPGSCEAIVDSEALVWPRRRWEAVLGAAPAVTLSIVQAIGRKLDEAHARLREMSTEEAARRVAHLLLRLWSEAGKDAIPTQGGIELPYPLSRQDIADMSGNTLHTVSRIMAAWESQGVLGRGRRKVVISDVAALQEIAGEDD
jgi:CRP-like cAMP-binding protein